MQALIDYGLFLAKAVTVVVAIIFVIAAIISLRQRRHAPPEGEIEVVATGEVHQIRPGTMYALNLHDKHILRARTELELACVFNPPLNGRETHDASGAYPLEAEALAREEVAS